MGTIGGRFSETVYRKHLRTAVAAGAAPHGYTLTLWTTGAVTIRAEGNVPSWVDVLLLLTGAALAFGAVGSMAFGGLNGVLTPGGGGDIRVWGGMHLPSVGLAVILVALLNRAVDGHAVWLVVGFVATGTFFLVLAVQFRLATSRAPAPEPAATADLPIAS